MSQATDSTSRFPPIHLAGPVHRPTDPYGLLPLLRRIRFEVSNNHRIVGYHRATRSLREWGWPTTSGGKRVKPSDLNSHRLSHHFLGPGCLCSSQELDSASFTEASIFMVSRGTYAGEYVAACVRKACKYWIPIERIYKKPGILTRHYPLRDVFNAIPNAVVYTPSTPSNTPSTTLNRLSNTPSNTPSSVPSSMLSSSTPSTSGRDSSRRSEKRQCVAESTPHNEAGPKPQEINPFVISASSPPPQGAQRDSFSLFMALDSTTNPGLTKSELRSVLARCGSCSMFTTKRSFKYHKCHVDTVDSEDEVIDLTGED